MTGENFILRGGAVPFGQKYEFSTKGGFVVFLGLSGTVLDFMRGPSLVKLTEHDNSAADYHGT